METNFNHEQSLTLISEMINRARNNVKVKGAYSLIYWGYVVAALAIVHAILFNLLSAPMQSAFVWLAMIPAAAVGVYIERRIERETLVKTHIDKIGNMVWTGFLISFVVFTIVIHAVRVNLKFELEQIFLLNIPVIMILLGMGQFFTACIYRAKMWNLLAAFSWLAAIACTFVRLDVQFIIFAACMIVGFAIPGHILNRQSKENHV